MDITIRRYFDEIKNRLEYLQKQNFIGDISFRLNHKEGGIANMNINLNRCLNDSAKDLLVEELTNLKSDGFTGNVEFKLIFNEDKSMTINVGVNQSVKLSI